MNINRRKIRLWVSGLVILAALITAQVSFAAPLPYQPLAPLPGIGDGTTAGTQAANNLPLYLVAMFKFIIGLAAVMAVVQITIGGIQYMSTDAIGGKSDGKERINQAILGLLLAIGAYLILYTVNPKTLEFKFDVAPATTQAPQTTGGQQTNTNPSTQTSGSYQKYTICYSRDQARAALPIKTPVGRAYTFSSLETKPDALRVCGFTEPRVQNIPNPTDEQCPVGFRDRYIVRCEATYSN